MSSYLQLSKELDLVNFAMAGRMEVKKSIDNPTIYWYLLSMSIATPEKPYSSATPRNEREDKKDAQLDLFHCLAQLQFGR